VNVTGPPIATPINSTAAAAAKSPTANEAPPHITNASACQCSLSRSIACMNVSPTKSGDEGILTLPKNKHRNNVNAHCTNTIITANACAGALLNSLQIVQCPQTTKFKASSTYAVITLHGSSISALPRAKAKA
jgi:hypothetical protein